MINNKNRGIVMDASYHIGLKGLINSNIKETMEAIPTGVTHLDLGGNELSELSK